MILPKWATKFAFDCFLRYVRGEPLADVDIRTAQRLLWLSDFFKVPDLEAICIKQYIIPKLEKENVTLFLEDAYAKISCLASPEDDSEMCEVWNVLLNECLALASNNLSFLIRVEKPALLKQEDVIVDELVERAFKMYMVNLSSDNSAIIDLMMQKKKKENPFDLLEAERAKIYDKEKLFFTNGRTAPTLTWNLANLKENFYRESEAFFVLGCYWVLSIWSFKKEGTLTIAIKQSKYGKEGEELHSESYYNKNKYFVNPSKKRVASPKAANTDNKLQQDSADGRVPSHCILTIASFIRIKELEELGKGAFSIVSLLTSSKSPTSLRQVPTQSMPDTGGKLSIEIYIKMEYTYSGILTYISRNFDWLYNNPAIGKLTKNQFLVLLKHKYLNVKREEDALVALCKWSMR